MLLILSILLAAIVAYILCLNRGKVHAFYLSLNIPGPRAIPVIGNGLLFLNKPLAESFALGTYLHKTYGAFYRVWLATELTIVVSDPKDVEILLSHPRHIDKAVMYSFLKPWLNEGLLLSTGKKWQSRRKLITPAFHFNILEEFVKVFDRLGNKLVGKLNKLDANDDFEFYPIAALYALDVMCETAMGVSLDALSKPNSEYVQAVREIAHVIQTRMIDFILRIPLFYQFSKLATREVAALRVLHGFTDDVITKRRRELLAIKINNIESGSLDEKENEAIGIRKRYALLDLLLQSTIDGNPLTDLEIREEVDTFMFEGHDTTTSGITFCLYNIAKHPEVQKKCVAEIVEVFGTSDKTPATLAKLNQLAYLELVIKETLRLFPSVPYIGRFATEDIKLTNNRVIPNGASFFIPIHPMQRNEKVFKNADQFKPERFLYENSTNTINPFTYIPFSAGSRNCIGQKFAMYEIKCIISKILMNFEVSLSKGSEVDPILTSTLVLKTESVIRFNFKRREQLKI